MSPNFQVDPKIAHHFSHGLYAKKMEIPAGYRATTHSHKFSHLSILAKGNVIVEVDGESTAYSAPACVEISAHAKHQIVALTDVVWFCVHATEETDEEKIDQVLIAEGVCHSSQ